MRKVFISYAPQDSDKVAAVEARLHEFEIESVKFDKDAIGTDVWRENVGLAMEDSDAILLVLSKDFIESPWCSFEKAISINLAVNENKRLVTLLLDSPDHLKVDPLLRYGFQSFTIHDLDVRPTSAIRTLENAPESSLKRLIQGLSRLATPIAALAAVSMLLSVPSFLVLQWKGHQRAELRQTQRTAQSVDDEVEGLLKAGILQRPSKDGENSYYRPGSTELLAADTYQDGVLRSRRLYKDGRVIAIDQYLFRGESVVGKIRNHVDAAEKIYLRDEFDGSGLRVSQHCPEHQLSDCISYVDDQQSGLPVYPFLPSFRY
jgi:hypothetical protein